MSGEYEFDHSQSKSEYNWREILLMYSPLLIALLVMLPRLISPQFGLFDDGRTIGTAKEIIAGTWDMSVDIQEGRSRPVYWLFFTGLYWIFGQNPFWLFLGNTLVLTITAGCLIYIVQKVSGSALQAGLAGLFFVLSGPIIESYYTLSKGEAVQLAMIGISLFAVVHVKSRQPLRKNIILLLVTTVAIFLSLAAKETTLVLIPISFAWLLFAWISQRLSATGKDLLGRWTYMGASVLAGGAFWVFRTISVSDQLIGGSYTNNFTFALDRLLTSGIRWAGWLIRDFLYLAPLCLLVGAWYLVRRRLPQTQLLLDSTLWNGAWIVIYLPWIFMVEYYMLPVAAGLAVFVAALLTMAIREIAKTNGRWQKITYSVIGLTFILFVFTLPGNYSNARIQLAVDAANEEVLDFLADHLPPNSVILINIQDPNEYYYETGWHLADVRNRRDIQVIPFSFQTVSPEKASDSISYFALSPHVKNKPLLTVRMGVLEPSQRIWNNSLQKHYAGQLDLIFSTQRQFQLLNIDLPRVFCPLIPTIGFCTAEYPLLDNRTFSYGWDVYAIKK